MANLRIIILIILLFLLVSTVYSNESSRIAGMGGTFAAIYNTESAIFGNPAGLINVQKNNISSALLIQNLEYKSLPSGEGEQLNSSFSLRLNPSIYYSGKIRKIGISLGYTGDWNNRNSTFKVEKTKAEYIIDERKFVSSTNTVMDYDYSREKGTIFSIGYPIKTDLSIGARLKYLNRIIKEGTIYRPLELTAVHGPDVNRNDATKLLPAIIDNLDVNTAIENFKKAEGGREDVRADLSGSGLDLDLGMQGKLYSKGNIIGGVLLEHLIQPRIIRPEPSRLTIGLMSQPLEWLTAVFDIQKAVLDRGFKGSIGWELRYQWERWFSGGVMLRNGFAYESSDKTENRLSLGLTLILGDSHWDYALVKLMDNSPITKGTHVFSSTIRF